jgi:hypothetical protein
VTFLELCQAVASKAGVSGTEAADLPSTVANQVGELKRIVDWVRESWREVQGRRKYNFLWEAAQLTLPIGENVIAASIPASRYQTDTARRTTVTSDGMEIEFIAWEDWSRHYDAAYVAAGNAPTAWTIRPDNALVFNGKPSLITTGGALAFTVERYKLPQALVADGDVPAMPEDLHDLIVYKALVRYANFDEAGVQRQTAVAEIGRLERDLAARCLPQMSLGGPLA